MNENIFTITQMHQFACRTSMTTASLQGSSERFYPGIGLSVEDVILARILIDFLD